MNSHTGAVDEDKLKRILHMAIEAYIHRVDGCPCDNTTIRLYKGAESSDHQKKHEYLQVFLKGSKKNIERLQQEKPELDSHFQDIWTIRNSHIVCDLPSSYIFF